MFGIVEVALCLLTGLLTKLTDAQTDDKLYLFKRGQYATGLAYGALAGFLITLDARLATLVTAITVGVLLTAKIDFKAHQLAIAALLAVVVLRGLPQINAPIFVFLAFFALFDELVNDFVDARGSKGRTVNPLLSFWASKRLSLEFATVVLGFVLSDWTYFIALLAFDIGYLVIAYLSRRFNSPSVGALGFHLTLDLFDCSVTRLEDGAALYKFLDNLPAKISMKKLGKPVVRKISSKKDEGYSGFVLISTSHASFHTFPRLHSCNIDVFSCKEFDQNIIIDEAKSFFKAKRIVTHSIERS